MSVTGLTEMHQLVDAAIVRFELWQQTAEAADVSAPRLENLCEKLRVLRQCKTAGHVRTALEHVRYSMELAGVPAHVLEPLSQQVPALMEKRVAAADRMIKTCDECGSFYFPESSSMSALCPECAHFLYGYETCRHAFVSGRCSRCYWDGSVSPLKKMREQGDRGRSRG